MKRDEGVKFCNACKDVFKNDVIYKRNAMLFGLLRGTLYKFGVGKYKSGIKNCVNKHEFGK